MSFLKFLISKTFLKQIVLAVVFLGVLVFVLLKWLNISTNNGQFETVPNLKGKSIEVAKIELSDNNLQMTIVDSSNFNPNYPKFSVIEQDPLAGKKVKENRKIYVTLNPSGYIKVGIPKIIGKTFRQAKPTLEALGFKIGEISYIKDIGKDEVIYVKYNGKKISEGTMLPKTTKIDLVLGNGK